MKWVMDDGGRSDYFPKGKSGDCAVRSIAIATGKDYLEMYNLVNETAKIERRGSRKRGISNAKTGIYKECPIASKACY